MSSVLVWKLLNHVLTMYLELWCSFFSFSLCLQPLWEWLIFFWVKSFYLGGQEATFSLAHQLGKQAAETGRVSPVLWQDFLKKQPEAAFVAIDYPAIELRVLEFVGPNVVQASPSLSLFHDQYSKDKLLDRMLHRGGAFPGEYLYVVSADLVPAQANGEVGVLGQVKVGYLMPGLLWGKFPLGRAFIYALYLLYGCTGALFFMLVLQNPWFHGAYKSAQYSRQNRRVAEEPEFTWIEDETGKTEPIFIDELGRSWKILLPDGNIGNWTLRANHYVSGGDLVLRPWAASGIRKDVSFLPRYVYQLRAQKMAGRDGFVVLFTVGSHSLAWVLGGWNSTRSEVGGYPQTAHGFKPKTQQWYFLEVQVSEKWVQGCINGDGVWKLLLADITHSSPNTGFQGGLGVAVWNTLARYADMRLYQD